jgi:hypothetical protein
MEKLEVKEAISRVLHSMKILEIKVEDRFPQQVEQLEEAI